METLGTIWMTIVSIGVIWWMIDVVLEEREIKRKTKQIDTQQENNK